MRTPKEISAEIERVKQAREARAAIPSEDGKWDESRALFIESCNTRLDALVTELKAARVAGKSRI